MHDIWAIGAALVWYAEMNDGRFPTSWHDLVVVGIAERLDHRPNALEIRSVQTESLGHSTWTVADVRRYKLAFGIGPDEITIRDGQVRFRDGEHMLLIVPSDKPFVVSSWEPWQGHYTQVTWAIAKAMKESSKKREGSSIPSSGQSK